MTNDDIKRIREMMGFLTKQKISETLKKRSSDEKKIYELTGDKGQKEIVKEMGISAGKISKIWQKLENEGLLIKEGQIYKKVI